MTGTEKVAVVTGASSGIGEATARVLAREGYAVALAARRKDRLERIADDIDGRARPDRPGCVPRRLSGRDGRLRPGDLDARGPSPGRREAGAFCRRQRALVPDGWFVNGDVVSLPDHQETVASEMIENRVRAKGWSEEDFMNQWRASDDFDDPATLHDQLDWLRESGFEDVTPVWQYYNFSVYGGRKSR